MPVEQLKLYSGQYIGILTEEAYHLVGNFFENRGLERVEEILSSKLIAKRSVVPLTQLNQVFDRDIGSLRFLESNGDTRRLVHPYHDNWWWFLLSVNNVLCEEYLKASGALGDRVIIPRHQLEQAASQIFSDPKDNSLVYRRDSQSIIRCGKDEIACHFPDALVVRIDPEQAVVGEDFYEFWINDRSATKSADQLEKLRQTVFNPDSRMVFCHVLQTVLHGQADQVVLPESPDLKVNLMASRQIATDEDKQKLEELFSEVFYTGLHKIHNLALLILKIKTGTIPPKENWQEYFTPVKRFRPAGSQNPGGV